MAYNPFLNWQDYAIPTGCHPIVRRLFEEMNARKILLKDVAAKSGIPASTISQWRTMYNPRLTSIEAALNTIGLRLEVK